MTLNKISLLVAKVKEKLSAEPSPETHKFEIPPIPKILEKTESKREIAYLKHIKKLEGILKEDPMTGLYTKQHFDTLEKEKGFYIEIDGDGLKKINDAHGHDAGHATIEAISAAIKEVTRADDFKVSRMGGDEFLVYTHVLSIAGAVKIAERILESINKHKISDFFKGDDAIKKELDKIPLQASLGVGVTEKDADKALYKAKHRGRNRVEYISNKKKVH